MAGSKGFHEALSVLCDVFELPKHTRKVTLTIEVGHMPVLIVEHFPTNEQMQELKPAFERIEYVLHEKTRALVGE